MKYRFNAQIRGNVNYRTREELESAIAKNLATINGFTLLGTSIELWTSNGNAQGFDGSQRFTVQLAGSILSESYQAVEALINRFVENYPQFLLTYKNIEPWQDGFGGWKLFNDDGSEYVVPVEQPEEPDEEEPELELEEVKV